MWPRTSQPVAALIPADGAERDGASSQGRDVRGHIAGSTREPFWCPLVAHQHDRDGCLRRDAGGFAAHELVEHEVAEYADGPVAEPADDTCQASLTVFQCLTLVTGVAANIQPDALSRKIGALQLGPERRRRRYPRKVLRSNVTVGPAARARPGPRTALARR